MYCPDFLPTASGSHHRKVIKTLMIDYMIAQGLVPVKETPFHIILKIFEDKGSIPFETWTKLKAPGTKKHLPIDLMETMINSISKILKEDGQLIKFH